MRLATALAAALTTAMVAGCGGGSGGGTPGQGEGPYTAPAKDTKATLTISNWGDPVDKAVYDEVAKRFQQRYPNVKVKNNFTPITTWSEYVNKLTTQVASGDAPDVINMGLEGVQLGMDKRLFASLDGYLKRDPAGKNLSADIDPRLVSGFQKDGQTLSRARGTRCSSTTTPKCSRTQASSVRATTGLGTTSSPSVRS
jgi:multiple sugar transport system substrate-binding protein